MSLLSPNMSLPVPVVSTTPGTDYAIDVNACMALLDSHNHSPGQGVQITPDGLDISSDLNIQGNSLTNILAGIFDPQDAVLTAPAYVGCVYVVDEDLYYNDLSGNQIRITQSGSVVGTPGSITGLVAPASATYVPLSGRFVWESDTNTPADMDLRSLFLRNDVASGYALNLLPPTLAADYDLTLPALPASQKFMTLDASGVMSAPWAVDNSSIEVSSNTVRVKAAGIATAMIADGAVTYPKLAAPTQTLSNSSSNFTGSAGSATAVTNMSVAITSTGRPVDISFQGDGSANASYIGIRNFAGSAAITYAVFQIRRNGVSISEQKIELEGGSNPIGTEYRSYIPPGALNMTDFSAPAGANTYALYYLVSSPSATVAHVLYTKMGVIER